jgi:hypothetical protein
MNGLDMAILVIVFLIVVGVLFAVKAWRHRRTTQHLIPLKWSDIYHDDECRKRVVVATTDLDDNSNPPQSPPNKVK